MSKEMYLSVCVQEALFSGFKNSCFKDISISGNIFQEKVYAFAEKVSNKDFM